jgi:hypothetical protein
MKIFALAIFFFSQFTCAELQCERHLENFLSSISESRSIQEEFILYPLKYIYVDKESLDMSLVEKVLSENEVKSAEFSAYPLKSMQKAHGLVQKVVAQEKESAKVSLLKPDTDYSLIYKFQLKSGCWFLVEIIDQSL